MKSSLTDNERAYILDSRLIVATSRQLYDTKLVDCGNYVQVYHLKSKKSIVEKDRKEIKLKKVLISNNENDLNMTYIDDRFKKFYDFCKEHIDYKKVFFTNIDNYKKKNKESKEPKVETRNITRSKIDCQRLAKCNADDWKTFITLTFEENITDISLANKELRKFINKIKRVFKDFKCIGIPEFQKRGAVHYHLLTNIDINDKLLIYSQVDNEEYKHVKYWTKGFTKVDKLENDIKKIIGYISKYMTKDIDNRLFNRHRYFYTRNLKKPKINYLDLDKSIDIDFYNKKLKGKELIYKNDYINTYNNEKVEFNEYL